MGTISDPEHFDGIIGQQILSTGTCLAVKDNDVPIGYLIISCEIRPEVSGLVSELKSLGIKRSILLTGDKRTVAAHVANISGMCEFKAELLPEQKLQEIKRLQDQGYKVAMVGDGINDAPSLAAANIGIAMGAVGTDVAIESADISLMADDLSKIPFALRLGKATLKTINHNIVFAIAFNLLAVIASSAGYLTPIMGAIVHNVGSVLVVVNSATLIRRRFGLST